MRTLSTILLLLLLAPHPTFAADCTWTGGTGNWHVAANWSCGVVPGAADDVTVNTFDANITLDADAAIGDFTFGRGVLTGSGDLTVNGAFSWYDGGTLGGSGTTTILGGSTFSSQVSMRIGRTLDLASNTLWSSGNITMEDGAVLVNRGGRTFTDDAVGSHSIARVSVTSTEPVVTNVGTWVVAGEGGTGMNVQFDNTGTLVVGGGGLDLNAPARLTNGATGVIQGSTLLDLSSGAVLVNDGSTQPGAAGTTAARLSVRGDFPMSPDHDLQIDLAGGTAAGTDYDQLFVENGDVTVDGRLYLTFGAGFVPSVGQAFDVLAHAGTGAVSGCYEEGDIVVSPAAYEVAVTCSSSGITAAVTAVTAGESPGATPEALRLSAAYPNPFRTQTTLTLTAPTAQRLTVELFDALGRTVATLFEGTVAANEPRALTLEAASLPSGLYVVRATGDDVVLTRRVTLLR